eukprot:NODE_464_length_8145_cov_0.677977.p1 type:complete len:530 gc:universal NODE_464_length_8145_cov_0.677977:2628-1039(-)
MFDINFSNGVVELKPKRLSIIKKIRYVIFIPNNIGYVRWTQLVILSVYFTVVSTPVIIAYGISYQFLEFISVALDVIFIIDLFVSLKTAFLDKTGKWVVNQNEIFNTQYKDHGFWMDVIGSVPIAWFSGLVSFQYQAFFRLNRLCRVFKVYLYFKNKEQELNAGFSIKLLKFSLLLALYILYSSCAWYMMGCWDTLCQSQNDTIGNWTGTIKRVPFYTLSLESQFITSLYFVIGSVATVGYGEIYPVNSKERIFCCILMISGNLITGYTIAIVTSDLANAKQRFIAIHERVISLIKYLKMGNISKPMQQKSINFYNEYWRRNRGIDFEALLMELPHAYRTDILYLANVNALRKISIFEGFSETFYRAVAGQMKPKFFLPGDIIFYQGDIGHEMYTIVHGEVEVCNSDCTKIFDTMGAGMGFGEIALILETNRTASIRAKSYVDVYYLRDIDLTRTMLFFPELVTKLEKVAEERLAKIKERDENVKLSKRCLVPTSIATPFYTPQESLANSVEKLNALRPQQNSNFLRVD